MNRPPGTTATGRPFDISTIESVWQKAGPLTGYTFFRTDACGAVIKKTDYGKTTDFGWEIDHILPVEKGGGDRLENLQPLHWENNRQKGEAHTDWECKQTR